VVEGDIVEIHSRTQTADSPDATEEFKHRPDAPVPAVVQSKAEVTSQCQLSWIYTIESSRMNADNVASAQLLIHLDRRRVVPWRSEECRTQHRRQRDGRLP